MLTGRDILGEEEFQRRNRWCIDRKKYCRAGGSLCPTENYGLPCVAGWISYEDGWTTYSERCVYCGALVVH